MPGLFAEITPLFAQDAGNSPLNLLVYVLPIPFLFYFLIWLPQQQQEKKRKSLLEGLKKNDKVVTASGIYGTVISLDAAGDRLVLRIDDDKGVKMTLSRSSVLRVLDAAGEKGTDAG